MYKVTLTHTSSSVIKEIDEDGLFGSFLFFARGTYSMGGHLVYEIDIDEDDIVEARRMFYLEESERPDVEEIVAEVAERFGVDVDTAIGFIDETLNPWWELEEIDGEDSWYIQHCTGRVARAMGFRGAEVTDEQGTAYIIDMLGKEHELRLVGEL